MHKKKDKVILVVSFGTTYGETRKLTIDSIEQCIQDRFKDYDMKRAFTSHMIIKVLRERDRYIVDTPEEALEKIAEEGYKEVIVQSLHIMPGEEYEYVERVVESYRQKDVFNKIELGRPILYFKGDGEQLQDDYLMAMEAIKLQLPETGSVVFMGHGTTHPANACYSCLQMVLRDHQINNVYIGTVEGYPSLDNIINTLKRDKVEEITLMPLMVVAGDHCNNDMASDEEDSWKKILEKEDFKVNLYMHGMGENPLFRKIFVNHVEDTIIGKYKNMGRTKKGI
ncbi:sirohydrochlorin cobaltochelatase [Clostridium pasteurianum]|uniref:Cobalamin biosynthesis protein CbiK, Co2+ chelatase n=1 Tax=Clostridium pasteurianum BC1 TaxID=86416 RepID=R4K6Q6_CLOPA|nr:sirohydrochlorin cobaltochelatase [Clostridium pasteurianum]AGK96194.1 cobalamin biosynthesis protein CbiK, Co2+ chelatase [Clostridium pasteurianum BC1]